MLSSISKLGVLASNIRSRTSAVAAGSIGQAIKLLDHIVRGVVGVNVWNNSKKKRFRALIKRGQERRKAGKAREKRFGHLVLPFGPFESLFPEGKHTLNIIQS